MRQIARQQFDRVGRKKIIVNSSTNAMAGMKKTDKGLRYIRYEDGSEELYDHRTDADRIVWSEPIEIHILASHYRGLNFDHEFGLAGRPVGRFKTVGVEPVLWLGFLVGGLFVRVAGAFFHHGQLLTKRL